MELKTRSLANLVVVEPIGKITIDAGSGRIHERIRELVGQGQNRLLVDLTRVDYMDSTGVGSLVASYTTTISSGGRIVLLNANEKVEYLLSITNLLKVFEIFQDEHDAVASFSG